jgi:putative ubiquitin-RnfH superfamily antitoxin RatB of RatAB toxin-antitoxin module
MQPDSPPTTATLHISVTMSKQARQVQEIPLQLPPGSTVGDALRASASLLADIPEQELALLQISLWGKRVDPQQLLRENDRVELCRPLKVDPKVARRLRFARQGAKTAGLFANRRPAAKAGY